jgi:hypothetical protein
VLGSHKDDERKRRMLILESGWRVLNYRVVYFPTAEKLEDLIAGLGRNALLRVRQTMATLGDVSHLLHRSVFKAMCLDLTSDLGTLRNAMDSTSRRWLNRAEKMSDRTRVTVNHPPGREEFVDLYNRFARLHAHSGPLSSKALQRLEGCSDLFMMHCDGRAVSGHLWLRDGPQRRVRLLFSASSRLDGKEEAALSGALNRLLHWHEIEFYKAAGIELYDLGGFDDEHDRESSLTRFKLSLGARIREENNYIFGRGLPVLLFKSYAAMPRLTTVLRGRLPA